MSDEELYLNTLKAICRILDGILQDKKECTHMVQYIFSRMDENHPLYQEINQIVFLLADVRSFTQEARDIAGKMTDEQRALILEEDD